MVAGPAQWPVPGILPEGVPMPLEGGLIEGFTQALLQMQKGGKYTVEIPAALAYGDAPPPGAPIPPNADLTFEIEMVDFMTRQEAEQRYMRMMQVAQEQAGEAGEGGAGGAPGQPAPQAAPAQE